MAFSDWYEILDKQQQGTQNIVNIYHAVKLNPAFDADDVLTAFIDTVIPEILSVQHETLDHIGFECQSLDEPMDFTTATLTPGEGLLTGQALTTFTAASIQFNRLRTDMKNGQKRFAAGDEAQVTANFWSAPFLLLMDDVAQALINSWEDDSNPGVPVARYGILKRVCTVDPPPDPCPAYRLPEDDDELVFYLPTSYTVRDTIRSQVSRKRLI